MIAKQSFISHNTEMSYPIHSGEISLTVNTRDWHCEGNGCQLTEGGVDLTPLIMLRNQFAHYGELVHILKHYNTDSSRLCWVSVMFLKNLNCV